VSRWKRKARGHAGGVTLVATGTEISGDIHFSGELEVQGVVRGNVQASSPEDAMLRIVEGGRVEGQIHAPIVLVDGEVSGDIHAGEQVELLSGARVEGNIHYQAIEIARGAQLTGRLIHTTEVRLSVVEGEGGESVAALAKVD